MQSNLSKQISSYCRLNFSNELIKQPKPLFYPKNLPQKPILFKKKCQKKSLKPTNYPQFPNFTKNPQKQPQLSRKNSLRKNLSTQSPNQRFSSEKNPNKFQFKNQTNKYFITPFPQSRQKIYKSLERQPIRRPEVKRNVIEELKNYQFQKRDPLKKSEPINRPFFPKFLVQHPSMNLNKSATYFMPRVNVRQEKKLPASTSYLNGNILLQRNQTSQSPIRYIPNINFSPSRNVVETRTSNLSFSSPLKLNKIPTLEKTQTLCVSEPHVIKRASQNINLAMQNDSFSLTQKFNTFFGEVNIQDDLRQDLIASIEFQPTKSNLENNPIIPSYIKPTDSQKSTFINSDSKFRKINSQSDFFETINLTKKSQFGQPTRVESNIRIPQEFSSKKSFFSPQVRRVETFKFQDSNENEPFQLEQNDLPPKDQFRQKCERRQNFRSIISVHSECETSSESEDSIIIDNHPKELISAKPIKTLF